jgi:hypothetical protein
VAEHDKASAWHLDSSKHCYCHVTMLCLFSMLLLHIGSATATDSKATSIPVVAELRFLLCG